MKKLQNKLTRGVRWSAIQIVIKRVLDFIIKLVLLTVLFPSDFGIVSIATAFSSLILVVADLGFRNALVQKKEDPTGTDGHYHSVFWTGLAWALLLYITILIVGAPAIATYYEVAILNKIIPILAFPILIEAATLIYRIKLLRDMRFKAIAAIRTVVMVLAGIAALIAVYYNAGIWSLVLYALLPGIFAAPLFAMLAPWRPLFKFNIQHLRDIFKFSKYTFITSLLIVLFAAIDYLIIGKLIDTNALGLYTFAFMFTILLSGQVTSMIDRVLYPFYSKLQENIRVVKKYYLKSLLYYTIVLYPLMLGVILLCTPLLKLFFDDKWIEAAPVLRILAAVVMVRLLTHGSTLVYRGLGKPKLEMFIYFISIVLVSIPAIYVGSFYGILGVSYGMLLAAIVHLLLTLYYLKRELSISLTDILSKTKAALIGVFSTAATILPLSYFTRVHIVILIMLFALIYGGIIYYFHAAKVKNICKAYLLRKF